MQYPLWLLMVEAMWQRTNDVIGIIGPRLAFKFDTLSSGHNAGWATHGLAG